MFNPWIEPSKYEEIKTLMPLPCVDLLIIHDGKLLLMLRNNEPGKDLWFTPGGRILKGESLEQAVNRVLKKETGLDHDQIKQVATMCHYWPTTQTVTTYYTVKVDTGQITMNNEHRDHQWITEPTPDLHPYLTEMITNSRIFAK
jgi:colanic acid biosynthesis protein WcaH